MQKPCNGAAQTATLVAYLRQLAAVRACQQVASAPSALENGEAASSHGISSVCQCTKQADNHITRLLQDAATFTDASRTRQSAKSLAELVAGGKQATQPLQALVAVSCRTPRCHARSLHNL
jgi:hypothetical protein